MGAAQNKTACMPAVQAYKSFPCNTRLVFILFYEAPPCAGVDRDVVIPTVAEVICFICSSLEILTVLINTFLQLP